MEEIREATVVWSLWNSAPASVKVGWLLLAGGAAALAFGAYALLRRDSGLAHYHRLAVLLARIATLTAVALCVWGVGTAVVESGNSIDTPRLDVIESISTAVGRAFLILEHFLPGVAAVMALSYVLEYFARRRKEKQGFRGT